MTTSHDLDLKKWHHKLFALHHELLYPAFLGAALFEFARRVIEDYALINSAWFFSGLWFVLYFSVAFLALAATEPKSFGLVSFFANLFEISIILNAIVSISLVAQDHAPNGAAPVLKYFGIYLSWLLIPITAVVLNICARRTIHTALSLCAIVIALIGMIWGQDIETYRVLLFVMYLLLVAYICATFRSVNVFGMDISSENWFGPIPDEP
jgi:hypothetical protein